MPLKPVQNQANLAEGVLGAAIVAKIISRDSDGIGRVGTNDVKKILNIMRKCPMTAKGVTKSQIKVDIGGTAKDKITFKLNLGKVVMTELRNFKDLSVLDKLCQAASAYVNSPRMSAMAEGLYRNNINNHLEIDVDGISDNKNTKADIIVRADNYVFDKISLKTSNEANPRLALGQVSGNTWSSILRLFYKDDTTPGMMLPVNTATYSQQYTKSLSEKPTYNTLMKAVHGIYNIAGGVFNQVPQGQLSKNIFKFLEYHVSKGDADIKIVLLGRGGSKTINPLKLQDGLKRIKLKAVTRPDTKWPMFIVYDGLTSKVSPRTGTDPSVLFVIRPLPDNRTLYLRHQVQEGPMFVNMLLDEQSADYNKVRWTQPSARKATMKISQACQMLGITSKDIVRAYQTSTMTNLSDNMWMSLSNSKSWKATDIDVLRKTLGKLSMEKMIAGFAAGASIPAPILLSIDNDSPYLIDGEERLMVARALQVKPKVILIKMLRKNMKVVV